MKTMTKKKLDGLKIALPNGSLEEGTLRLFEDANLRIKKSPRRHVAHVDGTLISEAKFVRPQHIPDIVEGGAYGLGICGSDCIEESGARVTVLAELPFGRGTSIGRTKVVLVTSIDNPIRNMADVPAQAVVLSEYPNITRRAFEKLGIPVEIRFSYGSTEAHIPEDYGYGVCLTDTGDSLETNKLKILAVLFESKTVLIANPAAASSRASDIRSVKNILVGTLEARGRVLLKMNVPAAKKKAVLNLLPALMAPTLARLFDRKAFAIETVVLEENVNRIIDSVLRAGATGVVQVAVSKIIERW